jgi:bifunctional enzyme CysN/CysC
LDSGYLYIIVAGHVDHGKSTIVGRLLADTGSLPDAGAILIVTTIELIEEEINVISTTVDPDVILTVWVGNDRPAELDCDCIIDTPASIEDVLDTLGGVLRGKEVIG